MKVQIQNLTPDQIAAHGLSLAALGGVVTHWLPVIAVIPPALFYCTAFLESKTLQRMLRARRRRKFRKRQAKRSQA